MKLVRIALAIIISLLLVGLICPSVQADDDKAEVELKVTVVPPPAAGGGGAGVRDILPPTIKNVKVFNITKTSADISWNTDEMSDSQVEYWSSPAMFTPLDKKMVIDRLVHLADLTPGTTYYFKVRSRDYAGNLAVSEVHTFTTLGKEPAAAFTIGNLSISPTEVNIGENVTISVLVTNTGDLAGNYMVTLKINGVVEASKAIIMLNAGVSQEVIFIKAKYKTRAYSVEVDGLIGSFTVKEKPVPPPVAPAAPEEVPPEEVPPVKAPINWPLIGIIAGVVAVGLGIFVLMRRRSA